ncbi:hypothetical protein BKA62DRAFT_690261 [Auriculariales sp. MPI-PUGE-AT-0066]|nr:hypothetical protein BKA62DRAFT_690261 [Auriculariales sp. MPI-PUGE-AT-0066]
MPPPPALAPIQIIVRLPYNRPTSAPAVQEPPHIVWNADKESILWELIARSRMSEKSATDWQGLSAHLGVPLPYLLYRAQARYEQDLKGLQNVGGGLHFTPQTSVKPLPGDEERLRPRTSTPASPTVSRPPPQLSPTRLRRSGGSSSTFTLKQPRSHPPITPLPQQSYASGSEDGDEDSDGEKAEEEEQRREEQENVARKLQKLQLMITANNLGFIRQPRGDSSPGQHTVPVSPSRQTDPTSASTSSSVRGSEHSLPSIPSPPSASVSSRSRPTSLRTTSTSSSARNVRSHAPTRNAAVERTIAAQRGSTAPSSVSSFSDLELDGSLTQSALDEALESNMRAGSRFSFPRSNFSGRAGGL